MSKSINYKEIFYSNFNTNTILGHSKNIDPNKKIITFDKDYTYPLICSTSENKLKVTKFLIEKGANPNVTSSKYKNTPLKEAATNGNIKIVRLLLEKGAKVKNTDMYFHILTRDGHFEIMKLLIENASKKEISNIITHSEYMMNAVTNKNIDAVKYLKKLGIKWSKEYYFASLGNDELETFFYRKSIKPNEVLEHLFNEEDCALAEKFMKLGGSGVVRDYDGLTLASQCHISLAKILTKDDSLMYEISEDRNTPLMEAILNENYDNAKLLIDIGVNPNIINKDGGTALSILFEENYITKIDKTFLIYLLENGANPNLTDTFGQNLLYNHLWHISDFEILIKYGLNLNMEARTGYPLLHRAIKAEDNDLLEYLLKKGSSPDKKHCGASVLDNWYEDGTKDYEKILKKYSKL